MQFQNMVDDSHENFTILFEHREKLKELDCIYYVFEYWTDLLYKSSFSN